MNVKKTLNKYSEKSMQKFITNYDLHLFASGTHYKIFEKLGAHIIEFGGVKGINFAVWAPNAESISVIGDFNGWQPGEHEMKKLNDGGIWSVFIAGLSEGELYKYAIKPYGSADYVQKTDPYAFRAELRPRTASVTADIERYKWNDNNWLDNRKTNLFTCPWKCPVSIYEVHLGSWKKDYANNDFPSEWGFKNYRQYAYEIVDYVKELGYTHVELLPVMEHPLDISWGYQVTNYYAPTSRYGSPEDFMFFVDYCHQNGIGVILDWVPAHFPTDDYALAFFDGTQIYAYRSWKKGMHKDWGTYIFDYGRNEVQNFLIGSALFWFEKYHIDGLRVDAVASMLYLDYSKDPGEWEPNIYGGRENLEAINFVKHLNDIVHKRCPGAFMIAEESTSWPGVSRDVKYGGLGFDFKWNMGWMNDVLSYFAQDPVHRKYHQNQLTFSLWYTYSENFILPVSHDEVVHGKKSLIEKMPGDNWQKFANARLFYGFMYGHPGKKLNFMTNDIGQYNEWNTETSVDWHVLDNKLNKKLNLFVKDINKMYNQHRALYDADYEYKGFEWIDFSDAANSILAFYRLSKDEREILVFVLNMTPVIRYDYGFGVPRPGYYNEILNSDALIYGGSGIGNLGGVQSKPERSNQWENSIKITLPPLAVVVFKLEG
jgi:1,4-alpha-glucan branching enzyme